MSYYFQLHTPRESVIYGKNLTTSGSGIRPGTLVQLDSGGATVSAWTSGQPFGFAFGARSLIYTPTSAIFALGEVVSVVQGTGILSIGKDFFSSGSCPTVGDARIYGAATGLIATSGSNVVGRLIHRKTRTTVGGTDTNVAVIRFNIQP